VTYPLAVPSQNVSTHNRLDWNNRNGNDHNGQFWPDVTSIVAKENFPVNLLRRYWGAALIILMVAVHAAVIGYVRSRVARLGKMESTAIEIGSFRFQPVSDLRTVYHFQLHAVVDPSKLHRGEERLAQMRMVILEDSEQMLRQVDPALLDDPEQTQIRERLMDIVLEHLAEPLVQRVLITDWLELPVQTIDLQLDSSGSLASH
jgi:hypothetical protein